ncbi:putative ankyrin-repeat protein [Balamuthia mandrillaris]
MDNSTGEPLLWYQVLGAKEQSHELFKLIAEETQKRQQVEALKWNIKQARGLIYYHEAKRGLLLKRLAKEEESQEINRKLFATSSASPSVDEEKDSTPSSNLNKRKQRQLWERKERLDKSLVRLDKRLEELEEEERIRRRRQKLEREQKGLRILSKDMEEGHEDDDEDEAGKGKQKSGNLRHNKGGEKRTIAKERKKKQKQSNSKNNNKAQQADERLAAKMLQKVQQAPSFSLAEEGHGHGQSEAEAALLRLVDNEMMHSMLLLQMIQRKNAALEEARQLDERINSKIRTLYYAAALRYHPDRLGQGASVAMFQTLSKAYSLLSNAKSRKEYNQVANHNLYCLSHPIESADIADASAMANPKADALRIGSGAPHQLKTPTVRSLGRGPAGVMAEIQWKQLSGEAYYDYQLEVNENISDSFKEVYSGKASSWIISDLQRGKQYSFRVRATNPTVGNGPWSTSVEIEIEEDGKLTLLWGKEARSNMQQLQHDTKSAQKQMERRRKKQRQKERMARLLQLTEVERTLMHCREVSFKLFQLVKKRRVEVLDRMLDDHLFVAPEGKEEDGGRRREERTNASTILNWPNGKGENLLIAAVNSRSLPVVQATLTKAGHLLDLNRADNVHGRTALHWATLNQDDDIVNALLAFSDDHRLDGGESEEVVGQVDVNLQDYEGNTALHLAVLVGSAELVQRFASLQRVDVNVTNFDETAPTALHMAASLGNLDIIEVLLRHGANIGGPTSNNDITPLFVALEADHNDVAMYLLRLVMHQLADAKAKEQSDVVMQCEALRDSVLHLAVVLEKLDVVKYLLEECGAPINLQDANGNTPLHHAYEVESEEFVSYLQSIPGCDATITNHSGFLPDQLSLAVEGGEELSEEVEEEHIEDKQKEDDAQDKKEKTKDYRQPVVLEQEEEEFDITPGLTSLPDELALKIMGMLYPRDVCALRVVSRRTSMLADDHMLWRLLFLKTYPYAYLSIHVLSFKEQNAWKQAFIAQYRKVANESVQCVGVQTTCRSVPPAISSITVQGSTKAKTGIEDIATHARIHSTQTSVFFLAPALLGFTRRLMFSNGWDKSWESRTIPLGHKKAMVEHSFDGVEEHGQRLPPPFR